MELANRDAEERPWGSFERFTLNELSTVKILTLLPDKKLSLQSHANRDEFWKIIDGSGSVVLGGEEKPARTGDEFFAERGSTHRAVSGPAGMRILEIALGTFDEHDEIRLADDYGRTDAQ